MVRSEIRSFTFAGDTTVWEKDNLFNGRIPDRLVVGIVRTPAFTGNTSNYPFAFEKFAVIRVRQFMNGEEYPYKKSLDMDAKHNYHDLAGYDRFLQSTGALLKSKTPMLKPSDWGQRKKCNLYVFNNVPSGNADNPIVRNPKLSGNLKVQIDFNANPGTNLTIIMFGEFESTYDVTNQGGVQYNITG